MHPRRCQCTCICITRRRFYACVTPCGTRRDTRTVLASDALVSVRENDVMVKHMALQHSRSTPSSQNAITVQYA